MKIDHEQNPLAIVRRYRIPYGNGLYLEGRIHAVTEDGFDEVGWFEGQVRYPKHHCEVGGVQTDKFYQALRRGAATLGEVEKKLRAWCNSMHLDISDVVVETAGVRI
jgi:hypothetical protein